MKIAYILKIVFMVFLLSDAESLYAKEFSEKNIPIQEGGRVKPLDTYARNRALGFYGKRKIKHENLSAIDWMMDLFIYPEKGIEKKIFFNDGASEFSYRNETFSNLIPSFKAVIFLGFGTSMIFDCTSVMLNTRSAEARPACKLA